MKKKSLLLLLMALFIMSGCTTKKVANKDTKQFRYELECAGNGVQGTYLVKVWSYSKNKQVAMEQCKKNAVHGVIFKGFMGDNQCRAQRPLVKDVGAEMQHADYFKLFFRDGGEYMKYVKVTSGTSEIIKVGREYKVGVVVSVAKDELRKALEAAGIVRSLSSGF